MAKSLYAGDAQSLVLWEKMDSIPFFHLMIPTRRDWLWYCTGTIHSRAFGKTVSTTEATIIVGSNMCDDISSVWARLRAAFVAAYPYLHMTKEGKVLMYQWMLLLGKTLHFDPASHVLGQVVRRTTQADTPKQQQDSGKKTEFSSLPPAALDPMRKAVLIGLSSTFVLGWLRQFRNLLHSQTRQESNEIPPPAPLPVKLNAKTRQCPLSSNNPKHCPICRQPRINPAAAPSGYVFCHRCIVMYVREYGKCPVTGTECPESRILRIYEPTTTIS
jgi:peroxin-12